MSKLGLALVSVALGLVVTTCSFAQTDTTNDVSLGELARTLRQRKTPVVQTVIDNDNMSKIMDQVEAHRQAGSLMFSFDNAGKTFHVSSPDVTCSLSFNAVYFAGASRKRAWQIGWPSQHRGRHSAALGL